MTKILINCVIYCVKWCIFTVWYCFYLRIWTLLSSAALKAHLNSQNVPATAWKTATSSLLYLKGALRSKQMNDGWFLKSIRAEWTLIMKDIKTKYSATTVATWLVDSCQIVDVTTWLLTDTEVMWTLSCSHASSTSTRLKFRSFPEIWRRKVSVLSNHDRLT